MLSREPAFSKISTVLGLTIMLSLCLTSFSPLVQAETVDTNPNKSRANVNKKERRTVRERGGLPVYRRGGGSRGNCLANQGQLIALVPEDSVSITASNKPQLFFYIPETSQSNLIEFVVRNQQDELVYETFLETSDRSGIITIELPESISQELLKTNEDYHWYLSMICDRQKRSHDIVVEGWLRRVEINPAIIPKLHNASPVEQARLYQQQGIWHDALSVLAQERKTPNYQAPAQAKWNELLNSIGLEELANQPLIETNEFSSINWLQERSSR